MQRIPEARKNFARGTSTSVFCIARALSPLVGIVAGWIIQQSVERSTRQRDRSVFLGDFDFSMGVMALELLLLPRMRRRVSQHLRLGLTLFSRVDRIPWLTTGDLETSRSRDLSHLTSLRKNAKMRNLCCRFVISQ